MTEQTLNNYIRNLKKVIIWNLGETNFTNDPGRGIKYPEKICNDWFQSVLLPRLKKLTGKKVIIADNLSTHLDVSIFQKCCE